jgi:hypothetical protein
MATLNGVNYSNSSGLLLKTNATTQMSISTGGVIEFNQSYTFPTADGSANTVLLTNGSGALSFSTIPNASLDNSSLTVTAGNGLVNGGLVSLGGSVTLNVGAGTGISVAADTVGLDTSNTRNVDHSSVSISAGTGLSGGGTIASNRTISLDYAGTNNFIDSATNLEGTSIATSDTIVYHDATDNNVKKGLISDLPFSNNSGTVTSVAISGTDGIDVDSGSPITSSGTITLGLSNIPNSSLANSSIDIAGSDISLGGQVTGDDIIGDVSAGQITNTQLANSSITINGTATSLGGSINVGDINGVTAGNGLTGGGTSGTVTLNVGAGTLIDVAADTISVDLSELSTSTSNGDGDFFVVVDTANAQKKLTKGNINISGFNNDAGFTTNTGTVTSVAISGSDGIDIDSGSPITGSGTIALGLSNVPNSVLSNSSFTVNAPSGSDPVVPLGGTLNFTSSDSSVTIAGNSGTDTIDLIVAGSVNTYVTGGTFTSGTLSLGLNDGTSAQDITGLWTSIPNSALSNSSITINGSAISLGGSITVGDITAVTAGNGLTGGGSSGSVTLNVGAGTGISVAADTVGLDTSNTRNVDHASVSISAGTGLSGGGTIASNRTISLDYAGTDNFIDSATNLEGTDITLTDTIIYHDATDNNVKKGLVSDLPFTNSSGSVTSVAISGSDGIDVDSGSPITTSGTIALGLSNVPNSSLANSSITINGTAVSLGGTINVGDITAVTAGTGLTGGGTSGAVTVNVDYAGSDNYILAAGAGTGDILTSWHIPVSNASNNVLYYDVLALPFTDNTGTVTSVAISGSDGIDVDSGSPITTNGTIALGLSNVPNSSLANSSVTVTGGNGLTGGGSVSLGGSVTLNVGAGTLIDVDGSNVNVDLSELTTSTANGDGDYFVVVDTANAQKKLTKANINLSGFNDNISLYKADGSLTSGRLVTQSNNALDFRATNTERTSFTRTTNTPNTTTRVFMEANDSYTNVLELYSTEPSTNIIQGFDAGQAPVFTVDGQGNLTATSKAFDIPHPNPEKKEQGMRLKHGNLEGPEHGIYIRGRQLNDKEIELPEYWKDLVDPDSITVQLTSVGSHQNLYVKEIKDWVVYIQNGNLFSNKIDCYYFIQAERIDVDKIEVEYILQ